ncbi:cytidylate kinase-like family protein [Aliifodinibius sp. S!AR15-10]|uniref:cytidylate kinase-like family protein n=1 Tax=Aliifodinibius sp. S!AR15-10 TaxID=2950437 RepID=UPI0028625708|nr:cytidylate kinase-like family protein [Aliifodinibius sp. S!AR15-10]MDR8392313.1 cytidylate kinase-like family protein [Aliifodinibius sp. S!AR15-10]
MGRKVTQIIEDQFNAWKHQNRSSRTPSSKKKHYPVITVSREFGALGAALAEHMGKRTGFKVWDEELLQAIAKELGSNEKIMETVDERIRKPVEDTVVGFLKSKNTNVNYLLSLMRVVSTIEEYGSSIIVGRGAGYICQEETSFHIRVVCPLKKRIEGYSQRENITKEEAREIIQEKDAERSDFIEYNFNKDVNNSSDYDILLNSGTFDLDEMADIALRAYEIKIGFQIPAKKTK